MTNYRIVQTYSKRFQAQYYDRQLLTNKSESGSYVDISVDHGTLQGARNAIARHKQEMERKQYVPVVVYEED